MNSNQVSSLLSVIFGIILSFTPGCQKPPPGMVLVSSGNFLMGTDATDDKEEALEAGFPNPWYEDEHPLRTVHLPAFYIDQFEVTNVQYKRFIDKTRRHPPQAWIGGTYPDSQGDHPVVFVNWYEADAYCRWLGNRLPTESEWEKAARGTQGHKYPWGNTYQPKLANISGGAVMFASSVPVGKYESGKSPFGVYDMIGNVWEWTDSWYQPYPGNTVHREKFGQKLRVTRGLSFMSVGHFGEEDYKKVASVVARASFRSFDYPTDRLADVGFRCAKSTK